MALCFFALRLYTRGECQQVPKAGRVFPSSFFVEFNRKMSFSGGSYPPKGLFIFTSLVHMLMFIFSVP